VKGRIERLETHRPEPELSPAQAQRIQQRIEDGFTPATRGLIDAGKFSEMTDDALILLDNILTDRGCTVQYPDRNKL
jgi:hypothetical protein